MGYPCRRSCRGGDGEEVPWPWSAGGTPVLVLAGGGEESGPGTKVAPIPPFAKCLASQHSYP